MKKTLLVLLTLLGISQFTSAQEDNCLWLEEVDGKKALRFVETQNKATLSELTAEKDYQDIYDKNLAVLNSTEKIAYPTIHGNYVYNFWKDANHVKGIWRRSTLESYKGKNPVWETLLDIDKLSETDGKKWVYKESTGLYPDYNHFLIQLSNGGGDAVYIKEFDVNKKQFIENGFSIDEAKGEAEYVDKNTLIVSTDFGEGTLTTSGFARQVKLWKRGTPLEDAQLIYEAATTDVGARGSIIRDGVKKYILLAKLSNLQSGQLSVWSNNKVITLDIPDDVAITSILFNRFILQNNQFIIQLKSGWTVNNKTYTTGTLISLNFSKLLKGNKDIKVILTPDEFTKYLDFDTKGRKITIAQLLDHTSGLAQAPDGKDEFIQMTFNEFPHRLTVQLVQPKDFLHEPREALIYNNVAFVFLGLIIEKVSGQTYKDHLKETFFDPLNMHSTSFGSNTKVVKNKVNGYNYSPDGLEQMDYLNYYIPYSADSLTSSTEDLLIWTQALHSLKVLSEPMYQSMITPDTLHDGSTVRYAKGLANFSDYGHHEISHGGAIAGF